MSGCKRTRGPEDRREKRQNPQVYFSLGCIYLSPLFSASTAPDQQEKKKKKPNPIDVRPPSVGFPLLQNVFQLCKNINSEKHNAFIPTKNSALGFISIWELQVMEKLSHIKRHMISRSEFSTILLRTQHTQLSSQPDKLTCFTFPKSSDENKKFSERIKIATKINTISCCRFNGL